VARDLSAVAAYLVVAFFAVLDFAYAVKSLAAGACGDAGYYFYASGFLTGALTVLLLKRWVEGGEE